MEHKRLKPRNRKALWMLLFSIFIAITAEAQSSTKELLSLLREELFTTDTSQIYLYEHIGKTRYPYKVDSSQRIRAQQPDTRLVLKTLESLMHLQDTTIREELRRIYDSHMKNFQVEWAQVYKDNYYAPDPIMDQYTVLSGFENCLKSLRHVKYMDTPEMIFDYYTGLWSLGMEMYKNVDQRCELIKQWDDISPEFRALNPCRVFGGGEGIFSHLDPYMEKLFPYFVEIMEDCTLEDCSWREMSTGCHIFITKDEVYLEHRDERIIKYYYDMYDKLKNCHRHTRVFKYSARHTDTRLSPFLARKIVYDLTEREMNKYPFVGVFTKNLTNENTEILLRTLAGVRPSEKSNKEYLLKRCIPDSVWQDYIRKKRKTSKRRNKKIDK